MGMTGDCTMAWHHWYHITTNPYGQWLRGDPRGWRERDHRRHVEGNYAHPPAPSAYNEAVLEHSKRLMNGRTVTFSPARRRDVGVLILESLAIQQIEVLCLGVAATHLHLLARCPRNDPKNVIGKAKNHVWMQLVNGGDRLKARMNVAPFWAVGSHAEPVTCRKHQVDIFWYILRHREQGAWVWCYLDPRDGSVSCRHERDVDSVRRRPRE
jgi:hypothetical protein